MGNLPPKHLRGATLVHSFEEGKELLCDIHAGICVHHAALRALIRKAFRHGFYWPTALAHARNII